MVFVAWKQGREWEGEDMESGEGMEAGVSREKRVLEEVSSCGPGMLDICLS